MEFDYLMLVFFPLLLAAGVNENENEKNEKIILTVCFSI